MTVTYKENQWRTTDRIRLPAWVIIAGQKHEVVDWSFSGFAIATDSAPFEQGKPIEIIFLIPFGHYAAQCSLQAEARTLGGKTVGFEFCHIPQGVRLLMRKYVEEFVEGRLEGRLTSFEDNVKILPAEASPAPPAPPLSVDQELRHEGLFRRKLIQHVALTVIVLLLVVGLLSRQRYINSTQAGLVGNTTEVRTRSDGFIKAILANTGDSVKADQLIVQLDEREARRNLNAAAYMQQRLEAAVGSAEKALAEERQKDQLYARVAGGRHSVEQARLAETDSLLAQSAADLQRAESLGRQGFLSAAGVEERRHLLSQRQAGRGRVKAEANLAADIAKEARNGRFFSDSQVWNRVTEMTLNLEKEKAQLAQATVQIGPLIDALEYTRIAAPQAGKVRIVTRATGEMVRAGDLLAVLETDREASILAKFAVADAVRISPGQKARIFFPALDLTVSGKIDAVGALGLVSASGLANAAEPALNEVPVGVRLDPLPRALPSGLRANVEVDTEQHFWTLFRQRLQ